MTQVLNRMNDPQVHRSKSNAYFHSTPFLTSHLPLYCVILSVCTFLLRPNNRIQSAIVLIIDAILVFGIAAGGFFTIERKELSRPGGNSTEGPRAVILGIISLVVFTFVGIMLIWRAISILIGYGNL